VTHQTNQWWTACADSLYRVQTYTFMLPTEKMSPHYANTSASYL